MSDEPDRSSARPGGRPLPAWAPVVLVALLAATIFVAIRTVVTLDGDISGFVVAGTTWADPSETPSNLRVIDNDGYDGQFAWRMATDPTNLHVDEHLGVRVDNPVRFGRIGYPALAWLLSGGGQLGLLPWVLVGINVACVGALAGIGAVLARDAGRSAWFGLIVASVPGFAFTLGRDLTELLAATLLAGGILASRRGRWWVTASLWSVAVLTREQVLIAIAAFGAWRAWEVVRRRERVGVPDAAWLLPGLAYVGWQLIVWGTSGDLPARSGAGNHFGPPFEGLWGSIPFWVSELDRGLHVMAINVFTILEFALLVVLVGAALLVKVPAARAWERWMVVAMTLLALSLTRAVWDVPADLRTLTDLSVLAWVLLITWGPRQRIGAIAAVQVVALVGAIGLRIHAV